MMVMVTIVCVIVSIAMMSVSIPNAGINRPDFPAVLMRVRLAGQFPIDNASHLLGNGRPCLVIALAGVFRNAAYPA
jgi:hypothetical protein